MDASCSAEEGVDSVIDDQLREFLLWGLILMGLGILILIVLLIIR